MKMLQEFRKLSLVQQNDLDLLALLPGYVLGCKIGCICSMHVDTDVDDIRQSVFTTSFCSVNSPI